MGFVDLLGGWRKMYQQKYGKGFKYTLTDGTSMRREDSLLMT